MSMSKKIALLGFLPDIERRTKQLIESNIDASISWVSATDSSVQGVVINAFFLETPQIQKYIQQTTAHVVCCYNDGSKQQAKVCGISGIHLTRHNDEELKHWIALLTGKTTEPLRVRSTAKQSSGTTPEITASTSSKIAKSPSVRPSAKQSAKMQSGSAASPAQPRTSKPKQPAATLTPQNKNSGLSKDYRMLLKMTKRPNVFLYAKSGNKETWICTSKNQAYINYKRDSIPKIDELSWKQQNSLQKQGKTQCIKLQMWLFESIWQSQLPVGPGL